MSDRIVSERRREQIREDLAHSLRMQDLITSHRDYDPTVFYGDEYPTPLADLSERVGDDLSEDHAAVRRYASWKSSARSTCHPAEVVVAVEEFRDLVAEDGRELATDGGSDAYDGHPDKPGDAGETTTPPDVTIRWSFRCNPCGHTWTEEQITQADGIEYAPPPVPRRCEDCEQQLRREPFAWGRTFEITEVRTFDA